MPTSPQTTEPLRVLLGITTYNRGDVLPKAIASALQQVYSSLRVMVIDDSSTDATPAIRTDFPEISWNRKDPPAGYRANRNEMMQLPGYDYYVSLDDDAWFIQNDEIAIAVKYLDENPQVAAVAFDILSPDHPSPVERRPPRNVNTFIGCGHVLRLSAAKEAGYYVETPGAYGGEEKDLCIRLMDLGYEIKILPGVHVWHDKAWSDRDWFGTHCSGVCNDLSLCTMRCPFPVIVLIVPYKIIRHLIFGIRRPRFIMPALAGITKFFTNFFSIVCKRKPVSLKTFRKQTQIG